MSDNKTKANELQIYVLTAIGKIGNEDTYEVLQELATMLEGHAEAIADEIEEATGERP